MTSLETIIVQPRIACGKGSVKSTRREGLVPGIIYGDDKEPQLIALDPRVLIKAMHKTGFFSRLFLLSLEGKEEYVLAKDVQIHPVSDHPLHVDFFRVKKEAKVQVNIPLSFINDDKSPGVKKGGVVNIVHHTLHAFCPAYAIPDKIEIDLSKLEINQGIHVRDLILPDELVLTHQDPDSTLVTIVGSLAENSAKTDGEK